MRRLIITGDDFGIALPVNEAIEQAHRRGILTTASLMVTADAAEDAVARARSLPSLKVGLHLVLVEGRAILPPQSIPDLVDRSGQFSRHLTRAGFNFFFQPGVRRQLEAEIHAQFQAFHNTGLPLDHVNAHNHMHIHPTVLRIILQVGQEFGLAAVRLPYEPPLRSWRAARKAPLRRLAAWLFLSPWTGLMKIRLHDAGVNFNDFVFGMQDSGAMRAGLVLRILEQLPEGVTEIYFHPATHRCPELEETMADYNHVDEFNALTSASVKEALRIAGVQRIAFSDL